MADQAPGHTLADPFGGIGGKPVFHGIIKFLCRHQKAHGARHTQSVQAVQGTLGVLGLHAVSRAHGHAVGRADLGGDGDAEDIVALLGVLLEDLIVLLGGGGGGADLHLAVTQAIIEILAGNETPVQLGLEVAAVADGNNALGGAGGPLAVLLIAIIAAEFGKAVSKETKVDILVTPLVTILIGVGLSALIAPAIGTAASAVGDFVEWATVLQPFWMGILVSVIVGIALTLPISSAAIGISLGLSGLAAGAAVVGCCCNMVGFAVASFRENRWSGVISQGIGTSMIQMPNIVRRPLIWLPAIISSAILGPVSAALFKINCSAVGSGMGTSGLVGPFETYSAMTNSGSEPVIALLIILLVQFVLPAILAFGVSEGMRKLGWIKKGDMRLTV